MTKQRLSSLGWLATATVVLLYVPMAAEYMLRWFGGGPQLWEHAYAGVVGDQHASGAGSIIQEQGAAYGSHRWVLLMHTALGAVAIALSVFQISARSRRRLVVHRWAGRVQVALVLVSMPAAMAFLVLVGPDGTFDGPAFHLQLWALAIGTLGGTLLGLAAIRGGQQPMHRVFMVYAFALLCTAPFLRLLYLVLGAAWPSSTQEVTNLAGGAILGVWTPLGVILASRTMPVSSRRDHLTPLPGRRLDRQLTTLAALTAFGLGAAYLRAFDGVDRITLTGLVAYLLGLAVTARNQGRSEGIAAEEWRIHHLAMLAALPVTAVLWGLYAAAFTADEAFYGALLTGPPLALTGGVFLAVWRRRLPSAPGAVRARRASRGQTRVA